MRPGRIDKKVQYKLATQAQAEALFLRFYPESALLLDLTQSTETDDSISEKKSTEDIPSVLRSLASQFSSAVPPHEFSTAELQGYLLGCKISPRQAAAGIATWVASEIDERLAKKKQEELKKQEKIRAAAEKDASRFGPGMMPGLGMGIAPMSPGVYTPGQVNGNTGSIPFGRDMSLPTAVTPGIPAESMVAEATSIVGFPVVDALSEQDTPPIDIPSTIPIQKPLINGVE